MRYARWYTMLLHLKPWHRYMITMVFLACMLCSWLLLLHLPLYRSFLFTREQVKQQRSEVSLCVQGAESCRHLEQKFEELMQDTNMLCEGAFCDEHAGMTLLLQEIEQAQLRLNTLKKGAAKKKDWYAKQPLQFYAEGSSDAIDAFFERLVVHKLPIECDTMTLDALQQDTYTLTCALSLFHFQEDGLFKKLSPSTLEKS